MQHHVFLSYGHEDADTMQRIRDALRSAGLRVWTDENLTPGTHSWKTGIETALENTGVLVVIMSPDSKESEWVERELDYARAQDVAIFPVLARGTESDAVPLELISTQWVDLRDATQFGMRMAGLIATIRAHIGDVPLSPLPAQAARAHRSLESPSDDQPSSNSVRLLATLGVLIIAVLIIIIVVVSSGDDSGDSVGTSVATLNPSVTAVSDTTTEVAQAITAVPSTTTSRIGKIVFGSERDGNNEIYVMNTDGANLVNLSNHEADDFSPSWSPDGSRIVFHSRRDADDVHPDNRELYIMDADGSNLQRLTDNPADDRNGAWSPDGMYIAFQSDRDGDSEIYVLSLDDKSVRQLTNNDDDDNDPAWSPDGTQIIFESGRDGDLDLYTINADCQSPASCEDSIRRVTNNTVNDANPDWSPDGTRIVYQSQTRRGDPFEIFIMNLETNAIEQLTFNNIEDFEPAWSPDGTQIVYHAFPSPDETDNREIYVMDAGGDNIQRLTDSPGNDWSADWSN
ncbi:MAG: TIR domain-containing protein [Chloroflexi bacterium]|nr:MAG: TIR domain-containing protein [Chloroflexota bacterium]